MVESERAKLLEAVDRRSLAVPVHRSPIFQIFQDLTWTPEKVENPPNGGRCRMEGSLYILCFQIHQMDN